MFSALRLSRPSLLRSILTSAAMQESRKAARPKRFTDNRAKKRTMATQGAAEQSPGAASSFSTPQPIASTAPPLTIPIPDDTPKFSDLAKDNLIHPTLLQTIAQDMKFEHMTPVQAATIHHLLRDRQDMLAQAKTGTGKTMAFLLPSIQTLITRGRKPGADISLLVISPTRELAMQIANEARVLLQRLPQYKVCVAIGGTNKDSEERRIRSGCDLLIGTPGRLLDHFEGGSDVRDKLRNVDTLVLDEADRLLDMGFLPALKSIIRCLPDKEKSKRQGMLFSATIADHVEKVAHLALAKDYKFISTIPKGEVNTHERVPQHLVVVPTFSDMATGLVGVLRQELAHVGRDGFKAIVFAPTAAQVDFYAGIIEQCSDLPKPTALHSRLSQSKRTNTSNAFREAKNGILVATDVIARGMDFPSVTNVIQAGMPADKESYIHRLGRTARAGAEGRGTFIITSHETFFSKFTLKDIKFEETTADLSAQRDILSIAERMDPEMHRKTYQAWLGFYKSYMKQLRWDSETLVHEANTLALKGLGSPEVPTMPKSIIGKMGLKGVKGLNIGPDPPKQGRGGGGRGGDQSGGWGGASTGNGGGPRNKRPRKQSDAW
ncbi:P-loop containing nucleoside triphosphate hydrolase protein [Pseudomassariella vexata]|uniref:ATP-dependent RNA helicase n=1 Tax=Pseudomassariella vexata TaxID=1141098 RepID=A0A1Y2DDH9_9PEZI|nr:P-loop containing nucleoside triphosphate hydrolase protein [Pseudomassariella vexata]ORY57257.1 P-loop containing nucleoside triphosphate hydrolase protein [Pseudomassariella vexata]